MAPSEHIRWMDDNIEWFENLDPQTFDTPVPSCPGWNVEKVITHLGYGLGLAYPYALEAPLDASVETGYSKVPWPESLPTGAEAQAEFSRHMRACVSTYRNTDPSMPCWTYDGPGVAAFWFRRAAIETTLHRMDVAEALAIEDTPVAADRAFDAVGEAVDFALPLAARIVGAPRASLAISLDGMSEEFVLGTGRPAASLRGSGDAIMAALWGRYRQSVEIAGDRDVAQAWLELIEQAFAGR